MDAQKWELLFERVVRRRDAERQRAEADQALMSWYDEQTKLVMMLVREVAEERARAFERATGQRVDVAWPSRPPVNLEPEGPFMSFMTLSSAEREVHLYSHRLQVTPPSIHLVVTEPNRPGSERRRVVSRAGCRIERRVGGGFVLVTPSSEGPRCELSADDVAYRAFEVLLAE